MSVFLLWVVCATAAGQTALPRASYIVWDSSSWSWYNTASNNTQFVIEENASNDLVYCDASGSNYLEYQYIMGVQVASINNIPTDNSHYADYTSLATTMVPEVGYPITITRGNPWYDDRCGVWVDWNQGWGFL